ncbi:DNA polymerase ligase N-terminal domain-containing protein [Guyparkeria halopsychrophila]|uniref:DNA polymerase ligase N-terminal domain-containing protein n=1 Tax=Guyparkeria halopsychrophila TaxID=3139421 RepID=UPI0037CBAE1E
MGAGAEDKSRDFVIQWHDASQRHFDVRLAVDGALKSWAVPKGPSTDPSERRLAIEVEDHALDYADFEGVIPEGKYGAGTVMVWDRGSYRNLDEQQSVADGLRKGLVEVWLDGEKIRGGYAFKRIQGGDKPQWLLIKMRDEAADARRNPVSTETRSVKSGRTFDEIQEQEASA